MIGMTAKIADETAKVIRAADEASYRNLGHAAASIRRRAKESIEISPTPSRPGHPPHSRRGQLPASLWYHVQHEQQATTALVGPRASIVGESASAHEFGKTYRGMKFSRRPFMAPALYASLSRFHESWRGSIRGD